MNDAFDHDDRAIARALGSASESETAGADARDVDAYREVLAHMPVPEIEPRAGLEDDILAAALARRPSAVTTTASARTLRRVRLAALAVATIAAAVVVGLIVAGGNSGSPMPGGHVDPASLQRADIDALLRAPGSRTGEFAPAAGRVVIDTDGNAAVYALSGSVPLRIGLVSRGGTAVVGPALPRAGAIAFVVDHPALVTAVTLVRNGAEIARAELIPS